MSGQQNTPDPGPTLESQEKSLTYKKLILIRGVAFEKKWFLLYYYSLYCEIFWQCFLIHFLGWKWGRIRICILVLMFGQRMFYNVYIRSLWSAAHRFSDGPCSLYTLVCLQTHLIIVIFGRMTFLQGWLRSQITPVCLQTHFWSLSFLW